MGSDTDARRENREAHSRIRVEDNLVVVPHLDTWEGIRREEALLRVVEVLAEDPRVVVKLVHPPVELHFRRGLHPCHSEKLQYRPQEEAVVEEGVVAEEEEAAHHLQRVVEHLRLVAEDAVVAPAQEQEQEVVVVEVLSTHHP